MKLDRLLAKHQHAGRNAAHAQLAAGRVQLNGTTTREAHTEVTRFDEVRLDDHLIQPATPVLRLMLHKPAGIVCATRDAEHRTVIDLIDHPLREQLHLVGRLDRSTTGLVLLTNDGRWSQSLMHPDAHVEKCYLVHTEQPIAEDCQQRFAEGLMLHHEETLTLPAKLTILEPCLARVLLREGRHHQVKKMFRAVGNRVIALHRERIGEWVLPDDLMPGEWREI